jgi:hypothetical protein
MPEFKEAILDCMNYLDKKYNSTGRIDKYMRLLEKADIKRKSRWNPIDVITNLKASTTFSSTSIHLAHNWLEWVSGGNYPIPQSRNLLHEAVHLDQYKQMNNNPRFWAKYIIDKKFRESMEHKADGVTRVIIGY